ncbi:MAG: enoyl-CoA hydratase/isomerase family protein [Alphaproteobacteria bacterium]|nr:enoyl-CoA hydratase/isomerase family protein [Alphaproteobacteria bacterium]
MDTPLDLAFAGAIATITLNRPEKLNAIGIGDLPTFHGMLDRVQGSAARVLVFTGTGTKAFCAGVDLGDVATTDWSQNPLEALIDRIEEFPLPTIAAINGSLFGAAADLALACDLRLGVADLRLGMPPAKLGVVLHASGLRRFALRLSANAARRLLLAAETMDAAELHRAGYLDRVVARDALAAETLQLAATLAALAPMAVRTMKRALVEMERGGVDGERLRAETLACFASSDLAEGLAAFAAKRPPRFTGQ